MHMCINTVIHSYIHTYIHTHTYTPCFSSTVSSIVNFFAEKLFDIFLQKPTAYRSAYIRVYV